MTPASIVAIALSIAVILYFAASAVFAYNHPEMVSLERSRLWNELMGVLIGGLVAFISRGEK